MRSPSKLFFNFKDYLDDLLKRDPKLKATILAEPAPKAIIDDYDTRRAIITHRLMKRPKRCLCCKALVDPTDPHIEIMGSHNPKYLCRKCKNNRSPLTGEYLIVYQPQANGRGHTVEP